MSVLSDYQEQGYSSTNLLSFNAVHDPLKPDAVLDYVDNFLSKYCDAVTSGALADDLKGIIKKERDDGLHSSWGQTLQAGTPIVEGNVDDWFWNSEDEELVPLLVTKTGGIWKSFLKEGPITDTRMSLLDSEIHSCMEELMFDQCRKQMGKPKSQPEDGECSWLGILT